MNDGGNPDWQLLGECNCAVQLLLRTYRNAKWFLPLRLRDLASLR